MLLFINACVRADSRTKRLADRLWYVTTVGGDSFPEDYGFGYVEALAKGFYGISQVELIHAAGLDLQGADVEAILRESERGIVRRFRSDGGRGEETVLC